MYYIVVEVTMNMAEFGSRRSQHSQNINFEPIISRLEIDIFLLRPSVKSVSYICKIQLKKKKVGYIDA